jgi:hypothetical protein
MEWQQYLKVVVTAKTNNNKLVERKIKVNWLKYVNGLRSQWVIKSNNGE